MLFNLIKGVFSFFWTKTTRNLKGNIYVGKNVKIEPSAKLVTDDSSIIGLDNGVYVGSECKILAGKGSKVVIGRNSIIHEGTEIITRESKDGKGGNIKIGLDVVIHGYNRFDISGDILIGDQARTGEGCHIHTHSHNYNKPGLMWTQGVKIEAVKIGKGCWVGTNVQIMPGVTVGEGTVIAAGSIVTKNIKSYAVAAGVPAKVLKMRFKS